MKSLKIGLAAALVFAGVAAAQADTKDAWLTTKAKIALLTTDGVSATAVNVDTVDGRMTIHGKVATAAEKAKAEQTVRQLDGVKDVKNLLRSCRGPEEAGGRQGLRHQGPRRGVAEAPGVDDINVASVNKAVLLSGKTASLNQKLLVIERVYTVAGVRGASTRSRHWQQLGIGHGEGAPRLGVPLPIFATGRTFPGSVCVRPAAVVR
jgi:osmotically-inducible protein OsmY